MSLSPKQEQLFKQANKHIRVVSIRLYVHLTVLAVRLSLSKRQKGRTCGMLMVSVM